MTTLADAGMMSKVTDYDRTRDDFENLPIGTVAMAMHMGQLVKVERVETHRVAFYSVNARKVNGRKGLCYIYGSSLVEVISKPEVSQ